MEGKLLPMKIIDADGTKRTVVSITNDVDDIGNAIAEGRLDESQRFVKLSEAYFMWAVRAEKQLLKQREKIEAQEYANGWIARFNQPWHVNQHKEGV